MSSEKFQNLTLFSERLKSARTLSGLSHDKVGEIVGCSGQNIVSLETGRSNPRKALRRAIELWMGGYESPVGPRGAALDEQAHYTDDAASLIAAELRRHPGEIEWVKGLLSILRRGGKDRRKGIQENIKAFLGDMDREQAEREQQNRAREGG